MGYWWLLNKIVQITCHPTPLFAQVVYSRQFPVVVLLCFCRGSCCAYNYCVCAYKFLSCYFFILRYSFHIPYCLTMFSEIPGNFFLVTPWNEKFFFTFVLLKTSRHLPNFSSQRMCVISIFCSYFRRGAPPHLVSAHAWISTLETCFLRGDGI